MTCFSVEDGTGDGIELAISVVVTSYNYGKYLDDALRSVQAQSFEDWGCIIVDDGSEDATPETSTAWVGRDRRFIYLRQENAGLSAARNAGLSKARGRYIQILDADDMILPFLASRRVVERAKRLIGSR